MPDGTPRNDAMSRRAAVFDLISHYIHSPDGFCWASNDALAHHSRMSVPTVRRHVAWLIQAGYLVAQYVPHPRGTERRLHLGPLVSEPPKAVGMDHYEAADAILRNGATHIPTGLPVSGIELYETAEEDAAIRTLFVARSPEEAAVIASYMAEMALPRRAVVPDDNQMGATVDHMADRRLRARWRRLDYDPMEE